MKPTDINHIEWMMKQAQAVCEGEDIDGTLLMPLVILHDTGYSEVPKKNPFDLDLRKKHMEAGAKITKKILEKINYPREKTEKIVYYVSVHDNWAFGEEDIYKKDKNLGIFTDLDFSWMATKTGFQAMLKILGKTPKEMIGSLESKENPLRNIPFSSRTTKQIYEKELGERKKEVKKSG